MREGCVVIVFLSVYLIAFESVRIKYCEKNFLVHHLCSVQHPSLAGNASVSVCVDGPSTQADQEGLS